MNRTVPAFAVLAGGAALLAVAVVAPHVGAQQTPPRLARVGFLGLASPESGEATVFRNELKRLGWTEDQNVVVDYRWAEGRNERFPGLAADLVRLNPGVIVSPCGPALGAIRSASRMVPVVSHCVDAKNFLGEVASLARPGGISVRVEVWPEIAPRNEARRLSEDRAARAGIQLGVVRNRERL